MRARREVILAIINRAKEKGGKKEGMCKFLRQGEIKEDDRIDGRVLRQFYYLINIFFILNISGA